MPDPESFTYRDIVVSLSGSLDLALSGYQTIKQLDISNRTSYLHGDIDDQDFEDVREVEQQLANVWLKAAESLLVVICLEKLFEGDSRVRLLKEQLIELKGQLKNLR